MDPADPERRPLFSLIFPTYHPGPVLDVTCHRVRDFLARPSDATWEVLFVCDGCTDDTADRLATWFPPGTKPVRILRYPVNRGKGYAVRHGLRAARGDWRIFTDVDLAYGFDGVERVAAALRAGAEVVVASRTHPHSRCLVPASRRLDALRRRVQGRLFAELARWLLSIPQRDPQAGLKGVSARAARLLLPRLSCDGFGFDCDLLAACQHLGLPVAEVAAAVRLDNPHSTVSLPAAWRTVGELVHLRRVWRATARAERWRPVPRPAGLGLLLTPDP